MTDGFTPPKPQSDFKPVPSGTHVARVVWLINIGWQKGTYKGEPKNQPKVILGWELPNELVKEGDSAGKPMITTKFYTNSLGDMANLRKDIVNWRGKDLSQMEINGGFSLTSLMGKACQITIVHKEKQGGGVYANVTAITQLMKGIEAPERVHDELMYSVEAHDQAAFDKLPDWIQKKCNRPGQTESENPAAGASDKAPEFDDDIPF